MWEARIGLLDLLDGRQSVLVDVPEAASEARERAGVGLDGRPAHVLEQVVVRVHAVEGGNGRMHFLQVTQVVIDEVR